MEDYMKLKNTTQDKLLMVIKLIATIDIVKLNKLLVLINKLLAVVIIIIHIILLLPSNNTLNIYIYSYTFNNTNIYEQHSVNNNSSGPIKNTHDKQQGGAVKNTPAKKRSEKTMGAKKDVECNIKLNIIIIPYRKNRRDDNSNN